MRTPYRWLAVVAVLALCLAALAVPSAVASSGAETLCVVRLGGARVLERAGGSVVEDYGSFSLVSLDAAEMRSLRQAQVPYEPVSTKIRLLAAAFDTAGGEPQVAPELRAGGGSGYCLVQFAGPIRAEWRDRLARLGEIVAYVPDYAFLARLDARALGTVGSWDEVRWTGAYHPAYRLAPGVLETKGAEADFVVEFFPGASGAQALENLGLKVKNLAPTRALVRGAPALLKAAAGLDQVMWIEPYVEPVLCNNTSRTVIKSSVCQAKGLTGRPSSQIVAVTDTGVWRPHEAFSESGKLVAFIDVAGDAAASNGDGYGHGTHVTGSVLGDAPPYLSYNKYDGQAFGARLVAVKVFNNTGVWWGGTNYYGFWDSAYAKGARTNNNSWGASTGGAYTASDRDADRIAWDRRDYVFCIAAGNSGAGGANTVGSPACSKNAIAVGALETAAPENVAHFSSRGPMDDERIKPDLMAPGFPIRSAERLAVAGYEPMSGTSMATPQVAGAAALVREYFMRGFYPSGAANPADAFTPNAALVKAALINGGTEMTGVRSDWNSEGKWPNNAQGWGRIDLDRSLYFAGDRRSLKVWDNPASLATGGAWTGTVDLPDGTMDLKVTLAWTDYPAAAPASVTLVNDLDLKVTAPDQTEFYGNNFAGLNPGYSTTDPNVDHRNTVEGVHLVPRQSFAGTLPTGAYTITVTAGNMPQPISNFAVVVTREAPQRRIAVMGDYSSQVRNLLLGWGYAVTAFGPGDYAGVIAALANHDAVVLHRVSNLDGFDDLLDEAASAQKGLVFLSSFRVGDHGMGVLSARTGDPACVGNNWWKGPVKLRVLEAHPVLADYTVGQVVTIISGGANDFQSYAGYTGTSIGANATGYDYSYLVGVKGRDETGGARHVVLGSFGACLYTDVAHWTSDGKSILRRAVEWACGSG